MQLFSVQLPKAILVLQTLISKANATKFVAYVYFICFECTIILKYLERVEC